MRTKMKLMAILSVFVMLAVCIVPISEESDATDGVLESLYPGSWRWDSETGIGPFNSFYAAFDMTDGNKLYAILNPYNLEETISGDDLTPLSNYNIMWVLPTVYWKAVGNDVIISNDSTSGGTAYAHTIDGKVYNYVAYGVYHGTKKTVGGVDVLTSESGVAPTASQTRATFRDQANNYVMDSSLGTDAHSMLWNFYQWTLYKLLCYTVMEDFNSQSTVGNGNVYGGNYTKVSGSLDTYGPYAGNNGELGSSGSGASTYGTDAAKLFIEEAWGTVRDFVDGVLVNGQQGLYINSLSVPIDSTWTGDGIEYIAQTLPSSGWQSAISTNEKIWGLGTASSGTWDTGLTDRIYTSSSSNRVLCVGGDSYTDASNSVDYGLSCAAAGYGTSRSNPYIGSRLAFVFDAGPASTINAPYTYTLNYDPTLMATTSAAISVAGMDPISHDAPPTVTATIQSSDTSYGSVSTSSITNIESGSTITISNNILMIGSTTVTATPTTATAQYTYGFTGWFNGSTQLQSGDTITSDITITARFTQSLNSYTVTIAKNESGWGTVSQASVTVPYGTSISASGSTLTIGSQTVTATPTTSTAQYTYGFGSWTGATGTVTGNKTVTANFTQTVNNYTVTIAKNESGWGTVSQASVTVPYGTSISVSGTTLTVGSTTITATPATATAQYTYGFANWTGIPTSGTVIGNTTITANFTQTINVYNVLIQSNNPEWGTVDVGNVPNTPYGSTLNLSGTNGNILTITNIVTQSETVITATASDPDTYYTYGFDGYETDGQRVQDGDTIVGARTIVANFVRTNIYTVIVQPSNEYGSVSLERVIGVPEGATITTIDDELTVYNQTSKAIPLTDTAQYTYAFTGWSVPSGTAVTGNMTVFAGFSRTVNTYSISIGVNDSNYGGVSSNTISDVSYGSAMIVDGNTITINGTTITATPTTSTAQYTYTFEGWYDGNTPIASTDTTDENTSITARFVRSLTPHTVTIVKNEDTWGTVSEDSITVPYGSAITKSSNTLTIGTVTVTATASTDPTGHYTYAFANWTNATGTVTSDRTITANFTQTENRYTISIESNDASIGTVSHATMPNVVWGTTITVSNNTLTIGTDVITATIVEDTQGQYTRYFDGWFIGNDRITSPITVDGAKSITARFHQVLNTYDITFIAGEYGSIGPVSVLNDISWGTQIASDGTTLTIGSATITAVPESPTSEYAYIFDSWTGIPTSGTVTSDLTITASFTQTERLYTVTWSINGTTETETYRYNEMPSHANPSVQGYTFDGWNPEITSVVADTTYTAKLILNVYTITWNANGGKVTPTSTDGSIENPIEAPTPTWVYHTFDGWFTQATEGTQVTFPLIPTSDDTYYAHWTAVEYTITLDGNGGTPGTATLTGSPMEYVRLPDATLEGRFLQGWYDTDDNLIGIEGTILYPSANVTYHAVWGDSAPMTFQLMFNLSGGYDGPTPLVRIATGEETSYTFTIPDTKPVRDGLYFLGWKTSTSMKANYDPGDEITVDADRGITLYAVWANSPLEDLTWLKVTIPIVVVSGLLITTVTLFIRNREDLSEMPKHMIAIAIATVLFSLLLIPILGGL